MTAPPHPAGIGGNWKVVGAKAIKALTAAASEAEARWRETIDVAPTSVRLAAWKRLEAARAALKEATAS